MKDTCSHATMTRSIPRLMLPSPMWHSRSRSCGVTRAEMTILLRSTETLCLDILQA